MIQLSGDVAAALLIETGGQTATLVASSISDLRQSLDTIDDAYMSACRQLAALDAAWGDAPLSQIVQKLRADDSLLVGQNIRAVLIALSL